MEPPGERLPTTCCTWSSFILRHWQKKWRSQTQVAIILLFALCSEQSNGNGDANCHWQLSRSLPLSSCDPALGQRDELNGHWNSLPDLSFSGLLGTFWYHFFDNELSLFFYYDYTGVPLIKQSVRLSTRKFLSCFHSEQKMYFTQ